VLNYPANAPRPCTGLTVNAFQLEINVLLALTSTVKAAFLQHHAQMARSGTKLFLNVSVLAIHSGMATNASNVVVVKSMKILDVSVPLVSSGTVKNVSLSTRPHVLLITVSGRLAHVNARLVSSRRVETACVKVW